MERLGSIRHNRRDPSLAPAAVVLVGAFTVLNRLVDGDGLVRSILAGLVVAAATTAIGLLGSRTLTETPHRAAIGVTIGAAAYLAAVLIGGGGGSSLGQEMLVAAAVTAAVTLVMLASFRPDPTPTAHPDLAARREPAGDAEGDEGLARPEVTTKLVPRAFPASPASPASPACPASRRWWRVRKMRRRQAVMINHDGDPGGRSPEPGPGRIECVGAHHAHEVGESQAG